MKAASIGRAVKHFALMYALVAAVAVPLLGAITAAILWIETGSPWAGPTVLTVIAAAGGSWLLARR